MAKRQKSGGAFRFRVSDSLDVPQRGWLLRLRLVEGRPSLKDLEPGARLRLQAPAGQECKVTVLAHALTGGRATQERLERTGELDVVIPLTDARSEAGTVDIGWMASGPVDGSA
jgi:hypothetical protein